MISKKFKIDRSEEYDLILRKKHSKFIIHYVDIYINNENKWHDNNVIEISLDMFDNGLKEEIARREIESTRWTISTFELHISWQIVVRKTCDWCGIRRKTFYAYVKFHAAPWQIVYAVKNVNLYDKPCETLKKLNFETKRWWIHQNQQKNELLLHFLDSKV